MTLNRPILELIFASSIWGFGFIATIWALESFGALWITVIRFAVCGFIGLFILSQQPNTRLLLKKRLTWRLGVLPGLWLAATLAFQTWGLKYTSATNSGFLTTLYVLFVPVLHAYQWKTRVPRGHFLWVGIALLGTALMCNFQKLDLNLGDFLTILCALAATLHIVSIEKMARSLPSNPFLLNTIQTSTAGLVLLFPTLLFDSQSPTSVAWSEITVHAWIGLLFLTFASSMLAFLIQIRSQRVVPAGLASLICLLESPFAALFAWAILHDRISSYQLVGGGLILAASALAIKSEHRKGLSVGP